MLYNLIYSHCPWTYNCIGASNHKSFMVFLLSLSASGLLYIHIAWNCNNISHFHLIFVFTDLSYNAPILDPETLKTCAFNSIMCSYSHYSTTALFLIYWLAFNLTWMTFLIAVQLFQISLNKTTNEMANSAKVKLNLT